MRILVVDGNPPFFKAAGNFLAALPGCKIVLAESGEEALVDYALRWAGGVNLTRGSSCSPSCR